MSRRNSLSRSKDFIEGASRALRKTAKRLCEKVGLDPSPIKKKPSEALHFTENRALSRAFRDGLRTAQNADASSPSKRNLLVKKYRRSLQDRFDPA